MTYLDTRDLAEELAELEIRRDDEDQTWSLDEDETARLDALTELRDEIGREWQYGAIMIPGYDFVEYTREYAEDIGAIDDDAKWPATCIDWPYAAKELSMDYSSVTFDGTDYFVRL